MSATLVIIDPQYDFHDVPEDKKGIVDNHLIEPALPVAGAWEDAKRLGSFIREQSEFIDDTVVLMDTHSKIDIAHSGFWLDSDDCHVSPFTAISLESYLEGKFRPVDASLTEYVENYLTELEKTGMTHFIWPDHTIEDTIGHSIVEPVQSALEDLKIEYLTVKKGKHELTEHFGAFKAEVPLPEVTETQFNHHLFDRILKSETVVFAGQALSHCVRASVLQFLDMLDERNISRKVVLLTDTSSNVAGFSELGDSFLQEASSRGVVLETSQFKMG